MADVMKVRLSAEGIQEVISALKKVEGQAIRTKKSSEGIGSNLRNELRDLGIGVALRQLGQFVAANIEAQAAVQDLVEITGASAEAISVLGMAAKKEGVSMEALGKGIKGVTKFMASLQEGGSEAKQTLAAIGLSAEDLVGKSLDQQLVTIANAMDKFSDDGQSGMNKAAIAMKIFGKSGTDMLQVMQRLSGDGFQRLQEEGIRTGQILSGDAAQAAKKAKEEMANLKGQVEGATNAFAQGLIPALGDAINGLTGVGDANNLDGFRKVGEFVGKIAKGITSVFIIAGNSVAYVLNEIGTQAEALWKDLSQGTKVVHALFSGEYRKAIQEAKGVGAVNQSRKGMGNRFGAFLDNTGAALDDIWFRLDSGSTTSGSAGKGTSKGLGLTGQGKGDAAKAAKEAAAEALAAIKRLQASQKQLLEEGNALNERSYDAGLISLAEYQERRRQLQELGNQQELDALESQLNAEVALGKQASDTKIRDLQSEIAIRKRVNEESLREDAAKAAKERQQAEEDARQRFEQGLGRSRGLADATLSNAMTRTDQAQSFGTLGDDAATRQRIDAYREWLGVVERLQATMASTAAVTGDEALAADAEALKIQIDGVKMSLAEMENEWQSVQDAGAQALASGMVEALTSIGDGTKSVSDAFGDMARSILSSLQQVLVKLMLMKAAEAMFGGSAAGSVGSSILKAFSFADGGLLRGPGTGTSDSILMWGSNGEFMQPSRAVSYYGADFMEALRGLRIPKSMLPGYADGGLVGGGAQPQALRAELDGALRIDLGDGLENAMLRVMKSPQGVRIQAGNAASNPKRFNRALGRR